MTLAVMEICARKLFNDYESMAKCYKKWGRRYLGAGFSRRTTEWILSDDTASRPSYENGAVMEISPVGWFANSEKEISVLSSLVSTPAHNHPEAIRNSRLVAMCIYYGRKGKDKEFIKNYAGQFVPLFETREEMDCSRLETHHMPTVLKVMGCQLTASLAVSSFLITNSFEDCLKTAIACGFDSDTTADVACAIAEAFYGKTNERLGQMAISQFKEDKEAFDLLTSSECKRTFHDHTVYSL